MYQTDFDLTKYKYLNSRSLSTSIWPGLEYVQQPDLDSLQIRDLSTHLNA
jgi:hypothetical protein